MNESSRRSRKPSVAARFFSRDRVHCGINLSRTKNEHGENAPPDDDGGNTRPMPKFSVIRMILIAAALFAVAGRTASAQLTCFTDGGFTPAIRGEGLSERAGDFL